MRFYCDHVRDERKRSAGVHQTLKLWPWTTSSGTNKVTLCCPQQLQVCCLFKEEQEMKVEGGDPHSCLTLLLLLVSDSTVSYLRTELRPTATHHFIMFCGSASLWVRTVWTDRVWKASWSTALYFSRNLLIVPHWKSLLLFGVWSGWILTVYNNLYIWSYLPSMYAFSSKSTIQ